MPSKDQYENGRVTASAPLQAFPTAFQEGIELLARRIREAGGDAWLTGGCVRDLLRGMTPADADIEVFGLPPDRLEATLRACTRIVTVGKAFGVFKCRDWPIDVSLPRTESKTAPGHRGFAVRGDPHLPPETAARRRDFTVNAIALNPLTGAIRDPMNGRHDLAKQILRHCSEQFVEDPLRVLRAAQLAARLGFSIAPKTIALCCTMNPETLPRERIFEEWRKLLVLGIEPSRGMRALFDVGWLRYYPELEALYRCPQDPEWHPEGDVWTHTLHCLDAFARERLGDDWEDLVVGFAVLCHDMGKPLVTETVEGRIRSPGHDAQGAAPARSFLERLTRHGALIDAVLPLVTHHMRPAALHRSSAGDSAIRRLAREVGRIDRLARVVSADLQGSPPRRRDREPVHWLLRRSATLAVRDSAPTPLVRGRDLIALGAEPGPDFGTILERCYEAQLAGQFHDSEGGRAYAASLLRRRADSGKEAPA